MVAKIKNTLLEIIDTTNERNILQERMTTSNANIANALTAAKLMSTQMIAQGLWDAKSTFALSNVLCDNYGLTQNESIIVIEEALKIA